jgi:CRISPR-associated endonuclease/helicase Cas3
MTYYAHSGKDKQHRRDWQLLSKHLQAVADGAGKRGLFPTDPNPPPRLQAVADGAGKRGAAVGTFPSLTLLAAAAGWLHDLGKYRMEFQQYLQGLLSKGDPRTWHKQAGAATAAFANNLPLAFAICGHHGGLPDLTEMQEAVKGPHGKATADAVWPEAERDSSGLMGLVLPEVQIKREAEDCLRADLLVRILFSCLVDADWADTGDHERQVRGLPPEPRTPLLDPGEYFKRVEKHIAERAGRPLEPAVKKARADVLAACLEKAEQPPGLYSLTVPTGGGKTLASLGFALKHAKKHDLRRIIYVAPYMTILEQNGDVIREALGVGPNDPFVFEHYSLAEPPADPNPKNDKEEDPEETSVSSAVRRAENWDAPVVVTTNVQFFESLFSNKPGRCRKLHNIARSVIILDECQTLPPGLAAPTCGMLKQVTRDLGSTVVLCTATQPAFDHGSLKSDERLTAEEIIPETLRKGDELDLFMRLKRAKVSWPKEGEVLDWPDVARLMLKEKSGLCVVNTKKAARAVFEELKLTGPAEVFHLSTGMCPQHRREKLANIKSLLVGGGPCYVVSTQLIEAGVDVDFPFLMREMGPFESVIQAAGRCNREGKLPNAGGRVVVFRSAEGGLPNSSWYRLGRDIVDQILRAKEGDLQIDEPEAIRDYFGRLYWGGELDAGRIQEKRTKFQFKTIALGEENGKHAYRLIDNPGEPVIVATWKPYAIEIASLLDKLAIRPRKALFRELGRFQVNLFPSQRVKSAHLLHQGPAKLWVWDGQYDELVGIVEEMLDDLLVV